MAISPKTILASIAVALVLAVGPAWAQGYRPADRWQDVERERYAACYAAHDQRLANFERRLRNIRNEIAEADEQFQWAVGAERQRIGAVRVALRHELGRVEAQRRTAEARSNVILTRCKKAADLAAKRSVTRPSVTGPRTTVVRPTTRTIVRGTSRVFVAPTPRSTGFRPPPIGGYGGVVPVRPWGTGGRGGIVGPGTRGGGSGCHHQPGTSQTHCGGG